MVSEYTNKYVLINMNLSPFFIREEVIKTIRSFFYERNFHEVLTPTLNEAIPIEPNIYPFTTQWNTRSHKKNRYLSTSPERGLKPMLAQGIGNCFAFGKCFRNLEGSGSLHTPEYMMLEWYRENATYFDIMTDLQNLILAVKHALDVFLHRKHSYILEYQGMKISLEKETWPIYSLSDLFHIHTGLDMKEIIDDTVLFRKARRKGYEVEHATWSELFDQIFVQEIESQMQSSPYFITDFPARLSPLCVVQKERPYLAERFEFFMCGMEIANGNNENTDYAQVRSFFEKERKSRIRLDIPVPPLDEVFIHALKKMNESGKNYAGIGVGIDRLAMIMADQDSLECFKVSF